MKFNISLLLLVISCFPNQVLADLTQADTSSRAYGISLTTKMHAEHSVFESLPYGDRDLGWLLAAEFHEGIGYWQIGVEYVPEPDGDPSLDYVLTPQLSLILKDRIFRAGVGVLWNYLKTDDPDVEDPWSEHFWQFALGLGFPILNKFEIGIFSYYVFEAWSELGNFTIEDVDYGVSLGFKF